jgi:hypothetical protein
MAKGRMVNNISLGGTEEMGRVSHSNQRQDKELED